VSWSNPQKIHIYAPRAEEPYLGDNWSDEVLGRIVLPLYRDFEEYLIWFWIGRYSLLNQPVPDNRYKRPGTEISDFIAFRISMSETVLQGFQETALRLIDREKCFTDGWQPLNLTIDFPIDRYCPPNTMPEIYKRRIMFIVRFLDATSRLVLESLAQNALNGWGVELNENKAENPNGSILESVHHLFFNTTNVPLDVFEFRHKRDPLRALVSYWAIFDLDPNSWEFIAKATLSF